MSEEEARTKWCPFSRTTAHFEVDGAMPVSLGTPNRNITGFPDECRCIGSKCMAWKDETIIYNAPVGHPPDPKEGFTFSCYTNDIPKRERWIKKQGRCGLTK